MKEIIKGILLPAAIFLCFVGGMVKAVYYFSEVSEVQSRELLEQAVRKAAVECYAVEGVYPAEFSYLEENYGITYDEDRYGIEYGCWASNVMPTIVVYEK